MLSRVVRCVRHTERGTLPTYPPRDLAEIMAYDPAPQVPPLRAVLTSPTFTANGQYLDQCGYDAPSQLLLAFAWEPRPVPSQPTAEDIAEARRWWDEEALVDFPFSAPADHTHAMALALTPLVRDMVAGPTPLFGVDASVRGAGKGKLARACLIPSLGPNGCTVASLPREEEETRKALTAYLSERRLAVMFDNVSGRINSSVLAKALTEPVWDDRTLGKSESVRYPIRCVWAITANNATYSDEIGRRLVPVRLVPQTARPELREGFKHSDLEAWITAHRADLVWALAVFVRAWQATGCPGTLARLGSYEAWVRVVGGILETAGYSGFLANREEILAAADPETATWAASTAAWWESHRDRLVPVRDLLNLAEAHGVPVNGEGERAQATSLAGRWRHAETGSTDPISYARAPDEAGGSGEFFSP